MGLYSSWGRQADFTARDCRSPRVTVEARGDHALAHCRTCGWRSPLSARRDRVKSWAARHNGDDQSWASQKIADVEQVRNELGIDRWRDEPPRWAELLVGQPARLLDELATIPELIEAAVTGELVHPDGELPDDPRDASLDGLHAGWAAHANDVELDHVGHWATEPPSASFLPLSRGYAPDLHDFLLDRVRLKFAYVKGERHMFVERGRLQDAGFVAISEQQRRRRRPEPAAGQLKLIVLGLRTRLSGSPDGSR